MYSALYILITSQPKKNSHVQIFAFYLITNNYFLTNNILFMFVQTSATRKWYIVPIRRKPGPAAFLPFLKQSIHKTKTAPLPALPHKAQSYDIKTPNLPKHEYRPKQFHQSRKFYKNVFLALFSYRVIFLPQLVFQGRFLKILSEITPASFLPDQVTTSPQQKPTSTPEVSSVIAEPQTPSAPPRVYTPNTTAETTQMATSEHHPTAATAFEPDTEPITNAELKVITERATVSETTPVTAEGQASPGMTVQPGNVSAGLEVAISQSQI